MSLPKEPHVTMRDGYPLEVEYSEDGKKWTKDPRNAQYRRMVHLVSQKVVQKSHRTTYRRKSKNSEPQKESDK